MVASRSALDLSMAPSQTGNAGAWPLAAPLLLLLACWLVPTWPWLIGQVTIPWDAKSQFYPQALLLARALHSGELPLWNPWLFGGSPQVADPQSLLTSPPFLLLAAFVPEPSFQLFDATVLVTVFLGAVAVLLFARDQGWHPAAGIVGGLVFAFGGSAYWRVQHVGEVTSLAFFAITLWLLRRALIRRSLVWGAMAGLAAACLALGRDQVAVLSLYLLAGWTLCYLMTGTGRWWRLVQAIPPLLALGLVALLLAGPPIVMTMLLAADSNRPAIDLAGAEAGSLHPALLLTLGVPHLFGPGGPMADYWGPPSIAWKDSGLFLAQNMGVLYVGMIPLLLLLAALVQPRRLWRPELRFFTIAFMVTLAFALGRYTPAFALAHQWLPGVDLFRRPADATFILGALLALLSAGLVHGYITRGTAGSPAPHRIGVALALAVLLAALALSWLMGRTIQASSALVAALVALLAAAIALSVTRRLADNSRSLAAVLLATVLATDFAWNDRPNGATGLNPTEWSVLQPDSTNPTLAMLRSELAKSAAPDRRDRVELVGLGYAWPNAPLVHGLEHTLGHNPIRLRDYNQAVGTEDTIAVPEQRRFTAAFPGYGSPLAKLLGLRLVATPKRIEEIDPKLRPGEARLVGRTRDAFVYELPGALPRVLVAGNAQAADFQEILTSGRWPDAELESTVLLEQAPAKAAGIPPPGRARIVSYQNNQVEIEADSPAGGHLVLHDVWHPWWRASLDGQPAEMLRANLLFRAVALPPGRHTVQFTFDPWHGAIQEAESRWPWATPALARLGSLFGSS